MRHIPLTRGMAALVDDADYASAMRYKWYAEPAGNTFYAAHKDSHGKIYLHRLLMGTPKGIVVDHTNGDGLDYQRSNMRSCLHADNIRNQRKRVGTANYSSSYKGVSW